NRNMIGEAQLRRMKPSSYIINTARGALIDENALVKAVTEKWIAGAALDAYVVEPLPKDHPLRSAPNLLITPHQASCSYETGEQATDAAAATRRPRRGAPPLARPATRRGRGRRNTRTSPAAQLTGPCPRTKRLSTTPHT